MQQSGILTNYCHPVEFPSIYNDAKEANSHVLFIRSLSQKASDPLPLTCAKVQHCSSPLISHSSMGDCQLGVLDALTYQQRCCSYTVLH